MLPQLAGKHAGIAVRVPVLTGSLVDFVETTRLADVVKLVGQGG